MPIIYNEKTREFHLYNQEISYIIKILDNDQPGQLYYGKRLTHREDFSHLFEYAMRDMSPYAFEGNSTFSLENIKQEYPTFGCGDMRFPAYEIERENGSHVVEFVYKEHKIYNGKPKLEGLPATYVESDDEAQTLELVLEDTSINTRIVLLYTIYEAFPVIARSVRFECDSDEKITLLSAMSACVDLPDKDYEMIDLAGVWARERHVRRHKLDYGIQSIYSMRGCSSYQFNPFLALARENADEFQGQVYGFSLVYSGNFLAQTEVDNYDTARVLMGIHPNGFKWTLGKGESFQTPEMVMVYSEAGLNGMSQTFHKLYRTRLARGTWRDKVRPILITLLLALSIMKISGRGIFAQRAYSELSDEVLSAQKPDIDVELLTVNEYSRPGLSTNEITGIVIHYTANPGSTAMENRDYFEGLKDSHITQASSNFVVGLDGEIVQCVPTWEVAYASNTRNFDTVSIECCHPDETGKFNEATYKSMVQLTAWLCEKFSLTEEDVIRHYDITGKICPKYFVENEDAWKQFKSDVKAVLDNAK